MKADLVGSRRNVGHATRSMPSLPSLNLKDGETHEDRLKKIEAERARWIAELEKVKPETRLRPAPMELPHSSSAPTLSSHDSPLHVQPIVECEPSSSSSPSPIGGMRNLRRLGNRTLFVQRAARALSHPPPNLERQASDTWGEALPDPIARAAERFDETQRRSRRQARLAMAAVQEDPASPRAAVDFELCNAPPAPLLSTPPPLPTRTAERLPNVCLSYVRVPTTSSADLAELFMARYNLDAPVERQVEAYPDPVWGMPLDKLAMQNTSSGDTRRRPEYSGIAFTGSPEKGKSPVRPKLPALRGATQRPTMHTLLPDSHFALGAFGNDKGLAFKRKEEEVVVRIWTLDESLFRARKWGPQPCESNDFWDSPEVLKKAFLKDWGTTTGFLTLKDLSSGKAAGRAFGTTKLNVKQLMAIRDELGEHYAALLRIFTFYACVDAATSGSVFGITKFGYTFLCRDAGLIGSADGEAAEDKEMMKVMLDHAPATRLSAKTLSAPLSAACLSHSTPLTTSVHRSPLATPTQPPPWSPLNPTHHLRTPLTPPSTGVRPHLDRGQ